MDPSVIWPQPGRCRPPPTHSSNLPQPPYMVGRPTLEGPLDEELDSIPFQTYDIMRGSTKQKKRVFGGKSKATLRVCGKLKVFIRVVVTKEEANSNPAIDLADFLTPKK